MSNSHPSPHQLIGERIKKLRKKIGKTQEQLCELMEISRPTLVRYERGEMAPSAEFLSKLKEHFEVSSDYILYGKHIIYSSEEGSIESKLNKINLLSESDYHNLLSIIDKFTQTQEWSKDFFKQKIPSLAYFLDSYGVDYSDFKEIEKYFLERIINASGFEINHNNSNKDSTQILSFLKKWFNPDRYPKNKEVTLNLLNTIISLFKLPAKDQQFLGMLFEFSNARLSIISGKSINQLSEHREKKLSEICSKLKKEEKEILRTIDDLNLFRSINSMNDLVEIYPNLLNLLKIVEKEESIRV
ncbi:MAG: helix-turn-helix transcriptional regulator [Vicingaceae bacterium]